MGKVGNNSSYTLCKHFLQVATQLVKSVLRKNG